MPYKRKYSIKRFGSGYNRAIRTMSKTAILAKQLVNLKRMVNTEIKEFNTTFDPTAIIDAAGNLVQLTNIPQGDTTITRDGSQCKVLSVYVKGVIKISQSATSSAFRLMLVWDRQTNQVIYTTADLLLDASSVDSINSPLNLNNKRRFKVLYDKTFGLNINGRSVIPFRIYKKLNMMIRFDGSTPSIADLTSNSLSLLMIGDEVTNDPTISWIARVRFVDN